MLIINDFKSSSGAQHCPADRSSSSDIGCCGWSDSPETMWAFFHSGWTFGDPIGKLPSSYF